MDLSPSLMYLCFFASLSVFALIPLRVLLTKVDEFRNHSSQLQHILHTFLCFSLSYAFLFSHHLRHPRRDPGTRLALWFHAYLNLMICFTQLDMIFDPETTNTYIRCMFNCFIVSVYLTIDTFCHEFNRFMDDNPGAHQTISTPFLSWLAWVIFTGLTIITYDKDHIIKIEFQKPFLPYVIAPTAGYLLFSHQHVSECRVSIQVPWWIKIVVGIVGNILASHYLKDKGYPLFWLLVCFTIFLMGNMAMMHSTCHTAIFGFLVGAILDIAGEIFGLNIYTWLVGGVCAALLIFFVRLDEFNLQHYGAIEDIYPVLRSLEPRVRQQILRKHGLIV